MNIRLLVVVIIAAALITAILFWSRTANRPNLNSTPLTSAPAPQAPVYATPPLPLPPPVELKTLRGDIKSIEQKTITVQTKTGVETIPLAETKDFQKVLSGTIEGGNAKVAPAALIDLKAGQEVMVLVNTATSKAETVIILK